MRHGLRGNYSWEVFHINHDMLIQFFLVALMAFALSMTWRRFRERVIPLREAISWSVLWSVAAAAVLLPQVTTRIAKFFGVGRGVDLILYSSVAVLFIFVFKLFIQHEKLERSLTELIRREALRDIDEHKKDV